MVVDRVRGRGWSHQRCLCAHEGRRSSGSRRVLHRHDAVGNLFLRVVLTDPNAIAPGQKLSGRGTLALAAFIGAILVPVYWGIRADPDVAAGNAVAGIVVFLAIMILLLRVAYRRGWQMTTMFPSCPQCHAYASAQGRFCSFCGARQ